MIKIHNELYHHGIKGQKWGVRRYQHKDGTRTAAGKKRYSENDNNKKLSTKKKIIIGSVIAASLLAGGIGAYKISNSLDFDRTIRAGRDFYRKATEQEGENGLNPLVYASFRKKDREFYRNAFKGDNRLDLFIGSKDKIKVAGVKTGEKIFNDLVKTNKKFADSYGHMSYRDFNGGLVYVSEYLSKNNSSIKDMYANPFFEELKNKGYSGIIDVGDARIPVVPVLLNNENNKFFIK